MLNCLPSFVAEKSTRFTQGEKAIYKTWLNQSFPQEHLKTLGGQDLSILSPGERNEVEGPDFEDALILIGNEFKRGKIEIHLDNRDWYQHGHHTDELYNDVVLHVVAKAARDLPIRTKKGSRIPVLLLPSRSISTEQTAYQCQNWQSVPRDKAFGLFGDYAHKRFQRKAQRIRAELFKTEAAQFFYFGIMDVLGYSRNRNTFRRLAQLLPIGEIYTLLERETADARPVFLESIFLGTAGFLKDPARLKIKQNNPYFEGLLKVWRRSKKRYKLPELSDPQWHFMGSRPANHPPPRLAALAQIICNIYPQNPAQLWLNRLMKAQKFPEVLLWVRDYFQIPAGLWRNHPLFSSCGGQHLLGRERIMDLMINYLFPFAWVVATMGKDDALRKRASAFAWQVPRGAISGKIERLLHRLNIAKSEIKINYLLQGIIEFDKQFCALELCQLCPLEQYAKQ